jgi:hypothetical protein
VDELSAFLRARLDDDERVAREATVGPWRWGPSLGKITWALAGPDIPYGGFVLGTSDAGCPSKFDAEHIARWDPARVLAEVQAKRAILDRIAEAEAACTGPDTIEIDGFVARDLVCLLAQPYAGHPGWREEWAWPA